MGRATRPILSDVTICAADSVCPELAARALEVSIDRCGFADAVLFSDVPVAGRFRHVQIERLNSLADYSRFCLKSMGEWIETPYALVVQWDGYVVDADAWDKGFRNYDYVGGPIYTDDGKVVVGNGGFSLRSRELLRAVKTLPIVPGVNEDWVISRVFRTSLERDFQIRFAPPQVAARFSYEQKHPGRSTFGFHGQSNFWRHETNAEVIRLMGRMPKPSLLSLNFFGLLVNCLREDRRDLAQTLYGMIREQRDCESIFRVVTRWVPAGVVQSTIDALEPGYVSGTAA